MSEQILKSIHIPFAIPDDKSRTIEKSDSTGRKRRYVVGVASGLKTDAHGERMTQNCISSFMKQANSGDVLLFPDLHGIAERNDIGILSYCDIQKSGDWYVENALYDEGDEVGPVKLEMIETEWKQINGLPPYTRPRKKGFSIEGVLPQSNISVTQDSGASRRGVLDDVLLDGIVLVPRPAYPSVATAVCKALGITTPERVGAIQDTIRGKLLSADTKDKYYKEKWQYQDALEDMIQKIMTRKNTNKREELEILMEEYKNLLIELVLSSETMFESKDLTIDEDTLAKVATSPVIGKDVLSSKLEKYRVLHKSLINYSKLIGE